MVKCISHNIEVLVKPIYHEEASEPALGNYVFMYEVTIKNVGDQAMQLISREWYIKDLPGATKIVKGLGVIGEQPIVYPGKFHSYLSGCNFRSTYGLMKGYYNFERLSDGKKLRVKIPAFSLVFPPELN